MRLASRSARQMVVVAGVDSSIATAPKPTWALMNLDRPTPTCRKEAMVLCPDGTASMTIGTTARPGMRTLVSGQTSAANTTTTQTWPVSGWPLRLQQRGQLTTDNSSDTRTSLCPVQAVTAFVESKRLQPTVT